MDPAGQHRLKDSLINVHNVPTLKFLPWSIFPTNDSHWCLGNNKQSKMCENKTFIYKYEKDSKALIWCKYRRIKCLHFNQALLWLRDRVGGRRGKAMQTNIWKEGEGGDGPADTFETLGISVSLRKRVTEALSTSDQRGESASPRWGTEPRGSQCRCDVSHLKENGR